VQVADGIHRLTPGVCNFYLIEDGDKLVLVDAGAPRDWDLLVRTLAILGRGLQDLEAVLITHAHSDHTGFAERARTTAKVPVWIHQADAAVAMGTKPGKNDGKARSYLLRVEFYRTLVSLARRGATKLIPIQDVSTFGDGETLEVPGLPRVVHAPGHTPGCAALLLEGRRVLLAGDVLATRNPLTGRSAHRSCPRASTAIPGRRFGPWTSWTGSRPTWFCPAMASPGPRGQPRRRGWPGWLGPPRSIVELTGLSRFPVCPREPARGSPGRRFIDGVKLAAPG
jgi:glyoxylase-like metal-dependent hydrolase (beta-lactamase superfamily II)